MGTGNTIEATQGEERKAVHPRGHGEHHDSRNHHHEYTGSSPWARGTLKLNKAQQYVHAVHPRGHGEHLAKVNSARFIDGSSPWARGTHIDAMTSANEPRFIPVGTGNTHPTLIGKIKKAVHPRGHGEHIPMKSSSNVNCGSSPWARGTP